RYSGLTDKELALCYEINDVLGDVCALLTRNTSNVSLQDQLVEAKRWDEQLEELKGDSHSSRVRLLYNIAHAARELLLEASEMVRLGQAQQEVLLIGNEPT